MCVYNAESLFYMHNIMLRIFIFLTSILSSVLGYAKPESFYQIDLIVFTHPSQQSKHNVSPPSNLKNSKKISLKSNAKDKGPYQILPSSSSELRNEFWVLNRKPQYRVLLNYSWKQLINNQNAVILPEIDKNGWHVDGSLRIQKDQYYLFDAELNFMPNNSSYSPFTLTQSQRLKDGVTYYLDHPQVGLLIKIHNLS